MSKIFITGGSRGIGSEVAKHFAKKGAKYLTICYFLNRSAAEKVALECRELGAEVHLCQLDLNNQEISELRIKEAIKLMEGIDVLINNAGITEDALALRMTNAKWDQVLQTNLTSPFFLCKIALKTMIRQKYGRIINLSSVIAQRSRGGQTNYAASKGALEAMTRALAVEVASRGITVNAVAPGWIDTEMTQSLSNDSIIGGLESTIPVGRTGTSHDVASLIYFLASAEAGYITGQVIAVDGGLSVRL